MLYHQNSLAQVKRGSRRLRRVPDLLAARRAGSTAARATTSREVAEVPAVADDAVLARQRARSMNVDCTVQVTAGSDRCASGRSAPARASARGAACASPSSSRRQPDDVEDERCGASTRR